MRRMTCAMLSRPAVAPLVRGCPHCSSRRATCSMKPQPAKLVRRSFARSAMLYLVNCYKNTTGEGEKGCTRTVGSKMRSGAVGQAVDSPAAGTRPGFWCEFDGTAWWRRAAVASMALRMAVSCADDRGAWGALCLHPQQRRRRQAGLQPLAWAVFSGVFFPTIERRAQVSPRVCRGVLQPACP